ncbi:MAG: hypothetical protein EP338_06160 [Bacteroidetes bacterium]|nr:MAG: hypothetical protein EP338_06160 [Bacteroidota bacterium]
MRKFFQYAFIFYLLVVITLLVIQTSKTGIKLNFYFLGIRSDHYIHAIMLLPFLFFCRQLFTRKDYLIHWLIGISFCAFCEGLHYFIPYREFSLADFGANLIGMSLGSIFYRLPSVNEFLLKRRIK